LDNNDKRSLFEKQYLRLYKKLYYCALAVLCREAEAADAVRESVLAMYAVYSGECTAREFDVRIFSALIKTTEKLHRNKSFSRDVEVVKDDVPQVLAEIKKISPKERLCLALNGIAGLSAADIADITEMKSTEVRANISDGRERLKNIGFKGLGRGVLIKGQEDMFPIPEKLRPENIGEMLDNGSMAITAAAMEAANKNPEIVRKQSKIPKIAAATAAVVVVAGTGFMLRDWKTPEKSKKAEKVIAQEEKKDDLGFVGLRRGSYKSLHTFLVESDVQSWKYLDENAILRYINDRDNEETDLSYIMGAYFRENCIYEGGGEITLLTSGDHSKKEISHPERFLQENDKVFDAGSTSIKSCKLDKGKAEFSEHDMMSETFIRKDLAENQADKEKGTEYGPYVFGMMLNGDELIALYDFYKPEMISDKKINQEYCGFCVFDKNSEELLYEYEQPGIMEDLIIGDNGRITVISRYFSGRNAAEAEKYISGEPAFLPETYENGEASLIDEDDIYISAKAEMPVLKIMSSIDTAGEMKCTDKLALTVSSSKIIEKGSDIWIASRCGVSDESAMQMMKIDTSAGLEIKAFGDIPSDAVFAFDDYISSFSAVNGVLYISSGERAIAFDEELNCLGQYKRTVYLDKPEVGDEEWPSNFSGSVLDGSTVYFAEYMSGEDDSREAVVLESADLSDINSPKVTSYKEDTLSAPVVTDGAYGEEWFADEDVCLIISDYYDDDVAGLLLKLVSLRLEDVVEGKASRPVFKTAWTEDGFARGYTEYDTDNAIPIRRPGVLSQIEDLKCEPNGILYCPINGKYCCLPLETEFDHDAYEISMNEYYQYLIDGEDDKVAEDYDEDGNTVYYYYNSKTAKQNYILIEIDGEELKIVGKTSFEPKDIDDIYHYPYLDVTGFVVYDDYLYIFSSQSLVESFPIKDIK
jgi:DNA-directed RNA polymerase specialized sigma24 family protein